MLRRERGWGFDNQEPDVWEMVDTEQGRLYVLWFSDSLIRHTALFGY